MDDLINHILIKNSERESEMNLSSSDECVDEFDNLAFCLILITVVLGFGSRLVSGAHQVFDLLSRFTHEWNH